MLRLLFYRYKTSRKHSVCLAFHFFFRYMKRFEHNSFLHFTIHCLEINHFGLCMLTTLHFVCEYIPQPSFLICFEFNISQFVYIPCLNWKLLNWIGDGTARWSLTSSFLPIVSGTMTNRIDADHVLCLIYMFSTAFNAHLLIQSTGENQTWGVQSITYCKPTMVAGI